MSRSAADKPLAAKLAITKHSLRRSHVDDVNQLLLATPPGKGAPPRLEHNYAYIPPTSISTETLNYAQASIRSFAPASAEAAAPSTRGPTR